MRRLCLLAALQTLFVPAPVSAAVALETLLARLEREPPVSEAFQEVRYRRALKAPLILAGTLTWNGDFAFERSVTSPYRETGRIEGRTLVVERSRGAQRIVPLARAPELQVLFSGLAALFAGDVRAIEAHFTVEIEGDEIWRLDLVPRVESLRRHVPALELRGQGGDARCLILRQENADTLTILGAIEPPLAAPDFASLVTQYCPEP